MTSPVFITDRRAYTQNFTAQCALLLIAVVLAGLLHLTVTSTPAAASAQFTILDTDTRNNPSELFFKPVCNARLDGVIWGSDADIPADTGDATILKGELRKFLDEAAIYGPLPDGHFYALCLSSPGGDLLEAIEIGKLFRGWMMVIDDGNICESACSIVFMSAAPRDRVFLFSEGAPGRFLHHRGRLGFHGPDLVFSFERATPLKPDQVVQATKDAYRRALDRMRAIAFPDDRRVELSVKSFLGSGQLPNAMPPDLLMSFLTVPHANMFYISSVQEALSWGIEIFGVEPPPALSENLLASACINVAAARCLNSSDGECLEWMARLTGQQSTRPTSGEVARNQALTFNAIALDATRGRDIGIANYAPKKVEHPKTEVAAPTASVPPESRESSEVFTFVDKNDHSMCDIRATWRGDRLTNLHLDLAAGKVPGQRPLVTPLLVPDMDPGNISRYHLRPWRMIPSSTPIEMLNMPDLWGKMVESGNFFSKPPNWK